MVTGYLMSENEAKVIGHILAVILRLTGRLLVFSYVHHARQMDHDYSSIQY
jgi:hypothetical protein